MNALDPSLNDITAITRKYWGFHTLRPLQREAIHAGVTGRDSIVVMPTGGGKSLCYQVPPVLVQRTDIVVSPLISLMKDQVDGLRACGYPAAYIHSGQSAHDRRAVETGIARGQYRLVFVAPERLMAPGFWQLVEQSNIRAFALDEAHCISHWGHDFRPEYRQLARLKQRFPHAGVHAYTATATARVRRDIGEQLQLRDPTVLVGVFDRPNLVYRVIPWVQLHRQIMQVVRRHKDEAVIIYCTTRADTERLAGSLQRDGIRAAAYHAGMDADLRRRTQDAFAQERIDVVVATVAFGMGIDRSNVRCVIHAAMPKSIEHYQQETGRAGRDGLEAECVLFYTPAAARRWESLIHKSAEEAQASDEVIESVLELLLQMQRACTRLRCRHKMLSEYFGQPYEKTNCGACDVCLEEVEGLEDGTVVAQKILSCVARLEERFGVGYVADVLHGSEAELILQRGHDQLSTHGLLRDVPRGAIINLAYQLVDQELLVRTAGDRPVLVLNGASWAVMRGDRIVRLRMPREHRAKRTHVETEAWEGVDQAVYERLRSLRATLAKERSVSAYVIFNDATLRQMARDLPTTHSDLFRIHGIGERRIADYGDVFLSAIAEHASPEGEASA